jgi:hypothetical protein
LSNNEGFIFLAVQVYRRPVESADEVVDDADWQERERMLDDGQIAIAWLCGLPYTLRADRPAPEIELLAAPVMAGSRYQTGRFIFRMPLFITRADSRILPI